MPLPTSHALLGASIVAAIHPKINKVFAFPILMGAFLANSADFDFALYWPGDLGIDFLAHTEWHRGFTHSILFSFFVFVLIAIYLRKESLRIAIAYGLAYFSHVVLDYSMTKWGGGLELFWFLNEKRYKLGWFGLSEMPGRMTILEISQSIGFEILLFGTLFAVVFYFRKVISKSSSLQN